MRRLMIAAVLVLGACKSLDQQLAVPVIHIPSGYIAYVFDPSLIAYTFVDTSAAGGDLHLAWVSQPSFVGTNCVALSPRLGADTSGSFVFTYSGPNVGQLARLMHGQLDSTIGYFIGTEGSHGTYYATSTGRLNLVFADGLAGGDGRYFNSNSVIRLAGDTIASDTDIKLKGDSVHAVWHVDWVKGTCQ
jgi:hypothetical protein